MVNAYKSHSTFYVPSRDEYAFRTLRAGEYDVGLAECLKLAQKGDIDAKAVAGWMLFISVDVERNLDVAEQLLHEASEAGSAYGAFGLAWVAHKRGMKDRCFELMQMAAQQNFIAAVVDLGRLYTNGVGTLKNPIKAEAQYLAAIHLHHRFARAMLLQLWARGDRGIRKARIARYLWVPTMAVAAIRIMLARYDEVGLVYNPPEFLRPRDRSRQLHMARAKDRGVKHHLDCPPSRPALRVERRPPS